MRGGPSGMAFALPLSGFGGGSIAVRFGKVDEIMVLDQDASDRDGAWSGAKKRWRRQQKLKQLRKLQVRKHVCVPYIRFKL